MQIGFSKKINEILLEDIFEIIVSIGGVNFMNDTTKIQYFC